MAYVALTMAAAFIVALPVFTYHAWAFVAPGLYPRERRILLPLVVGTVMLFVAGGWLCRSVVLPAAFSFLLANSPGAATIMVGDYLAFFVRLVVAFGLSFELPVVVFVLSVAGLIDHRHLIRVWRYFVVAAFVLGAVLTPPDPASQFAFASSLCALYGVSIGIAYVFGRKRANTRALMTLLFAWGARRWMARQPRGCWPQQQDVI